MTKTKPMTDEWRDKLHTWIDRQYGTAGWEQKLENLIDSLLDQATSKAREEGYKEGFRFGQSQRTEYETNAENAWLKANPPCFGGKPWRK